MNWKGLSNFGDSAQSDFPAIKIILSEMNIDWIIAIASRKLDYLFSQSKLYFLNLNFSVTVLLQKSFIVVHLV